MAILSAVSLATDVDPVDAAVGGLFDELIKIAVVHDPGEPMGQDFHIGMRGGLIRDGDTDVGCLSGHVLTGWRSSHEGVELRTSVAATEDDGPAEVLTQGLEHLFT